MSRWANERVEARLLGLAASEAGILLPSRWTSVEVNWITLLQHISGYSRYEGGMRYTECKTVQRHWFQFKNKMKNGKKLRQGRKEVGVFRWSMKTGGKYVTKPTTSIFLRGSFIPKLFHLQKNLWIKIYVKLWQLFVLIQRFMLFFLSGEEREVMRSSRYCLESKRRIAVNDRGLLICFHALNI